MSAAVYAGVQIAVMAGVTFLIRALPFLLFRKKEDTPPVLLYLGQVLPCAIVGMLVVYCLKDVSFFAAPFGLAELLAGVSVVLVQCWKRNSLLSILTGTVLYMILNGLI